MKERLKEKMKSYKFWTSLSAAFVMLFETIGRVVGFIPNGDLVNDLIMGICGVLVVFGIVSKDVPKTEKDDKEQENTKK